MSAGPFHVMTKPIGPICNLDCAYCFYLEKEKLYPGSGDFRMSDELLESYVRQYLESQEGPETTFAWQGGEPTLLGLEFFRKVVDLQRKLAPAGRKVFNALQTNGTLLDDAWCAFFKEEGFLIGISVDGPAGMHDHYRVDKGGAPTFDKVMRGLAALKRHGVEFNTLTVVHDYNARRPRQVYEFLREHGSGFMQFIPLVERRAAVGELAPPPGPGAPARAAVTKWSVDPDDYGTFLCEIFDAWVRRDVGKVFVQLFDVQLGIRMGLPSSLCVFGETCGSALALEHNGDLYSCDHYVYPHYKLGNILDSSMAHLAGSAAQMKFGNDKRDTLPKYCRECEVRSSCHGECPKHRFMTTPDGEPGLNYLCPAYKRFFNHANPFLDRMAWWLDRGQPAARIMEDLARLPRTPVH